MRRPQARTGLSHARAARGRRGERDAEVGHQRLPLVEQDVLGLDVAVDHVLAVCIIECTRHFARDADGVGDRQLPFTFQARAQRFAGDQRHHVVQQPVGLAAVEQRQNVRMLQAGGGADLGEKSFAAERRAQVGMQHFDRDITIVLEVVREIHGGHAAGAELAGDSVAVDEGDHEAIGHGGHGVVNPSRDAAPRRRSS